MSYVEAIKDGVRVVHRVWQLVLVQLATVAISSIGFFILVGIPLAIAFIIFSIDLTTLRITDIFSIFKEPSEIISKYFWLFLIVIVGLLIYILLAVTFSIYVFGGSIGVIGKSLRDNTLKFHMNIFFIEAKRLFFPILGFSALIGLVLIAAAFVLGILGGGIAVLVSFAKTQDSTLALFLGAFFSLTLLICALVLILAILTVSLYGAAVISLKGTGAMKSLKEAINFVAMHPKALGLYMVLLAGYFLLVFLLMLIGYPFRLIPVIGPILSFPYQLLTYIFQTYIGLVFIATVFTYYYSTELLDSSTVESSTPQTTIQSSNSDNQNGEQPITKSQ